MMIAVVWFLCGILSAICWRSWMIVYNKGCDFDRTMIPCLTGLAGPIGLLALFAVLVTMKSSEWVVKESERLAQKVKEKEQ